MIWMGSAMMPSTTIMYLICYSKDSTRKCIRQRNMNVCRLYSEGVVHFVGVCVSRLSHPFSEFFGCIGSLIPSFLLQIWGFFPRGKCSTYRTQARRWQKQGGGRGGGGRNDDGVKKVVVDAGSKSSIGEKGERTYVIDACEGA